MTASETMTAAEFRAIRLRLGKTQPDLAAWGGVTEMTIRRYETGKAEVPLLWVRAMRLMVAAKDWAGTEEPENALTQAVVEFVAAA